MDWERRYQSGDTPWEKGYAAPPLEDYLALYPIQEKVLVPGCGLGHDVRLLAKQGATVTGLDIAPSAIAQAKRFTQMGKIFYVLGDFFHLPQEFENKFDWLVEHTCFCAIDPNEREAYVKGAWSALKPGGKLFGIFYLNPEVEEGPPFGVKVSELNSIFNHFFLLEKEWRPLRSYEGREGKELIRIYQKKN